MKTILITTITVVLVCGFATALGYLLGARGHALQAITMVTWGLSIPTAYTTAGISLFRATNKEAERAHGRPPRG